MLKAADLEFEFTASVCYRYRILLEAVIKQLPGEDMSDPEYQPIQQSLDSMLTVSIKLLPPY